MARGNIRVEGSADFQRAIDEVRSSLEPKQIESILLGGARVMRDDMKRRVKKRSGRLYKAIKAKVGKRRGKEWASAFAAVDRKIAPHAHLVENGTVNAPAHPYFRPSIISTRGPVLETVTTGLRDGVIKAARRAGRKGGGKKS
jgi:HK97 gp10 family phage protein